MGTGLVGAPACLSGDTLIALADGRKFARLDDLAAEAQDLTLYSYNDIDGIRIRRASTVRLTKKAVQVLKVTLDNGFFKCTSDHLVLCRNGSWLRAMDLNPGQSLMPFNRIVRRGYYSIYGNFQDSNCNRPAEHKLIYQFFHGPIASGMQIHHKNHRKLDNHPDNLEQLSGAVHLRHHVIIKMHTDGWKPQGRNINGDKNPMREWWFGRATEEEKRLYKLHMSMSTSGDRNGRWSGKTNDELVAFAYNVKQQHGRLTTSLYRQEAKLAGYPQNFGNSRFGSWAEFMRQVESYNHRVVTVEPCGVEDVYCMSVEHDECFAIVTNIDNRKHTGVVVHNCGDVMRLQIKVGADGLISDAKFKTFGCGSAIAASSLATEWIKGMSVDEAENLTNQQIVVELSLPPVKIHCSVLAQDAIKSAIADWRKKRELVK